MSSGAFVPGLITVKDVKDNASYVYAWCYSVGVCQILRGNRPKAALDSLVVGRWYNFWMKPDEKRQGKLIAYVEDVVPISSKWSSAVLTNKRAGRQFVKVFHVPALVGAVQTSAGVAFAWSPFFHRIAFQQLNSFSQGYLKTGAVLTLTIVRKLVDDDCCWAVLAIEGHVANNAVQQMGIAKVTAVLTSFDANKRLYWAKGEKGEKICFGACDIDKRQEDASEFKSGDKFLVWIGQQRRHLVDYHRAIYVRRIDSAPPNTSFGFRPPVQSLKKKQAAYDEDDWWPLAASASSSSLPSVAVSPLMAQKGTSTVNDNNGFIIINNQQKTSEEKRAPTSGLDEGKWWQRVPELEPYLANGRQLYKRIMKHLDVCGPIIQRDPALIGDLLDHFYPQD